MPSTFNSEAKRGPALMLLLLVVLALLLATACAKAPPTPSLRGDTGAFTTPRPAFPTAVPAQPPRPVGTPAPAPGGQGPESDFESRAAALSVPAPQRLIVRTVTMSLVVSDLPGTLDDVADLAVRLGGWVVSTQRTERHRATISVRVPATALDEAVKTLRGLAQEVKSEVSTSQDVSDEYVDIQSRVRNLQATEARLLELLARPGEMKDILEVNRELTTVREEIERHQGRIRFLEETAAFSLIESRLELAPAAMTVDAGPDQTVAERESSSFRATITAPEDIEDFSFEWDFGDGTPIVTGNRTAPTADGKSRTTATVTHSYADKRDSPFIVTFSVTGTGGAGLAKGNDTKVITVTSVPNVQAVAGEDRTVRAGERVDFTGTFTRPEGITGLTFTWDFGDGLSPVTGPVTEGATSVRTDHVYSIQRPEPYVAFFTVTGETDYGAVVKATTSVNVLVLPEAAWVTRVWDFSEAARIAVQALSALVQTAGMVAIVMAVLSPIWAPILVGVIFFGRRRRKRQTPKAGPRLDVTAHQDQVQDLKGTDA